MANELADEGISTAHIFATVITMTLHQLIVLYFINNIWTLLIITDLPNLSVWNYTVQGSINENNLLMETFHGDFS